MKKLLFSALICILAAGCASTDRMLRMSGGVLDEYSVPQSSRIRSDKYQKVTENLTSSTRSNRSEVAGLDDTLINIWPFFFRNNDYWSALWPLIDSDPYGFAFRPFYNHEGDDYSILFPLSAWNNQARHGWVGLWAWNNGNFGLVPFTWQWKNNPYSGGAYYTPLVIFDYDNEPFYYRYTGGRFAESKRFRNDFDWFVFLLHHGKNTRINFGQWKWLFDIRWEQEDLAEIRSVWHWHFKGSRPFPANREDFEKFRQAIFYTLGQTEEKSYGFLPLWYGNFAGNGDCMNRFMLIAGNAKYGKNFEFDILGDLIAGYEEKFYDYDYMRSEKEFTSWVLLSYFSTEEHYVRNDIWHKLNYLQDLCGRMRYNGFNQHKPAVEDTLRAMGLTLPDNVTTAATMQLFLNELKSRYELETYRIYSGRILPLLWYGRNPGSDSSYCILPPLLTWWGHDQDSSYFTSWPLLTFIRRAPHEERTTILSPLVYYAKTFHRDRTNYRVFSRSSFFAAEVECTELRDQYAACGLFYRGRFGFNVAREGVDPEKVERLRILFQELPVMHRQLAEEKAAIDRATSENDRWQTVTEIERLRKLIRYEELKIRQAELLRNTGKYNSKAAEAKTLAESLDFPLDEAVFADAERAGELCADLIARYTELRFYEDIGNGVFFHKEKYSNGDHRWHLLHILAGGEKSGDKESTHILHLLYRYRKEGNRSEKIYFPFISTVEDGDDYKFSFLWRVFSIGKRNGKTGGHILFIPFGNTEE